MKDIVSFRPKSFASLGPVLRSWAELNRNLGADWAEDQDAPWWYNERASLSILAGAIWQAGGWAFEEFSSTKTPIGRSKMVPTASGRCDIMFGIGHRAFVAEAKQSWPNLGGSLPAAIRKVSLALATAKEEALRNPDWGFPRLGIVFAVPFLHESKAHRLEQLVSRFVVSVSVIRGTSVAYAFPAEAAALRPPSSYRDYIFPGAALLVSTAKARRDA